MICAIKDTSIFLFIQQVFVEHLPCYIMLVQT